MKSRKALGLRAFEGDGLVTAVAKGAEQVEGSLPHGCERPEDFQ